MFLVFGLALIAIAVQLFRHRGPDPSVQDNVLIAAARRLLPLTGQYHGGRIVALAVIVIIVLATATLASLRKARADPTLRAHAGSLREPRQVREPDDEAMPERQADEGLPPLPALACVAFSCDR
jgi:hypothetical protein